MKNDKGDRKLMHEHKKAKRYDEAIELCKYIKNHRGTNYCSRAEGYIRDIEILKNKR